jgi:hypothetical protein
VRIDSGFAGVRPVMTRRARALQRTNGRHLGTRRTDGGAVGRRPLDDAALSDMAKDRQLSGELRSHAGDDQLGELHCVQRVEIDVLCQAVSADDGAQVAGA